MVKSEIIKEKSYFFLVWKFQEKVENGSLASRSKQVFLLAPHKAKYSLALILLSLFCWRWEIGNGSNIHIVYFLDTHLTHLRLSETETGKEHLETGKANVREVANKTWNLLEGYTLSLRVLPEIFQKCSKLRLGCSPPLRSPVTFSP